MLNHQLISNHIIPLNIGQTVEEALTSMDNLEIHQLPVVDEGVYLGLLEEEDLLDANSKQIIKELAYEFHPFSVLSDEHISDAVKLSAGHDLALIPVVDSEKKYLGSITQEDLFRQHARINGVGDQGALIVLEVDPSQVSFGELSRLVETNDAQITQLNTYTDELTGKTIVTIRLNKKEVSDIVATFQRYEYHVLYFFGKEEYENELNHNYRHLLNYLEI